MISLMVFEPRAKSGPTAAKEISLVMSTTKENYYIGVDVGTGSVRVSLFSSNGRRVASNEQRIETWTSPSDHRIFEQSTENIWTCLCSAIRECLSRTDIEKGQVKGVGFDATCSLAVTDFNGKPILVSSGQDIGTIGERNVVLWADHRAEKEAEVINATGSVVLDHVGGKMSLEMEIPKILWLKNNMPPERFSKCQFFDLPDFLTYKATQDASRSTCSLTCKCSYVPDSGWQKEFFHKIGLGELVDREFAPIGARKAEEVLYAGMPVGEGLTLKAAGEMGLVKGTPVGSAIVDAYAGWLGTVAARYKEEDGELSDELLAINDLKKRLAIIAGTSTCHIVQSEKGISVTGVWGPYKDPIMKGWWVNEGGQSSTGQLIDFIITTHPAYEALNSRCIAEGKTKFLVLHEILESLKIERKAESLTELTKDLHVYPDFHGNRSPIGDSRMRGAIIGLELSASLTDLALKYHATLLSIALQTGHILDRLNDAGHNITSIFMSGGQVTNKDLMRTFANVCDLGVVLPDEPSVPVVLGAAMLGKLAHVVMMAKEDGRDIGREEQAEKLWDIMVEMTPCGTIIRPEANKKERRMLTAKYSIFLEIVEMQQKWIEMVEEAA